jgi:hypothetical protein
LAAAELARFPGRGLHFPNLENLGTETARSLSRAKVKAISFGLVQLSPPSARMLSETKFEYIAVTLEFLSPETAKELARFQAKEMSLVFFSEITPAIAEALVGFGGSLHLIHPVISPEIAAILRRNPRIKF